MRAAVLLACVLWTPAARADDGHGYVLRAELDPEAHTVTGEGTIRWRNDSRLPAGELYLHLYLNAFESDDTVFMREGGGSLRGERWDGEGRIGLTRLELEDGTDLLDGADDELIARDHTQLRVLLPRPVGPGATITLHTRFVSTLPPVFARSGYSDSFHMVAQWFPKVARREADGHWATFPYHARGEFYADFGRYELTVRTPSEFVVGATGALTTELRDGDFVERTFVADRVHDTAFCAWDAFEERRFDHAGVDVRILHPPGYDDAVVRHEAMTRAGLDRFGELFGDYPYPSLTVIVPPAGAEGAAGMEYPTLFLTAGPWFVVPDLRLGFQESVTAHELAHQWFQGMVATDEVTHPMLDEGITQWATAELLRHVHGERGSAVDWPGLQLSFFQLGRVWTLHGSPTPPPGRPAYAFVESDYGRSVYGRTTMVLETIRRSWGAPRFEAALGAYARDQRYRHPTPDDLYRAFDDAYWPGFSRRVLAPALRDGEDTEVALTHLRSYRDDGRWVTEIDARRVGRLPVPTWIELAWKDGRRVRFPFDAHRERVRVTNLSDDPPLYARLDPDRHLLLDPESGDNIVFRRTPDRRSPLRIVVTLFQQLLSMVGP